MLASLLPSLRTRRGLPVIGLSLITVGWFWSDPLAWLSTPHRLDEPTQWHDPELAPAAMWNEPLSHLQPSAHPQGAELYRERARAWLLQRFQEDRGHFLRWEVPASPAIAVHIHADSVTPASCVEGLDAEAAAERQRCEQSCVESRVLAWIPGIRARDFLRFQVHSDFERRFGPLGGVEDSQTFGPLFGTALPRALEWKGTPRLPANHGLRRELTRGEWLRAATCFSTTLVLDLGGEVPCYRWELLLDEAPPKGAEIRCSAGVLFARDVADGALIWHHSYYAGQSIPSGLQHFAARRIEATHAEYLRVYAEHAAAWCRSHADVVQRSSGLSR